jgi:hypothetical protein
VQRKKDFQVNSACDSDEIEKGHEVKAVFMREIAFD